MAEYYIANKDLSLYYCGDIYAWTSDKSKATRFNTEEEAKQAISELGYGLYTIVKEESNE